MPRAFKFFIDRHSKEMIFLFFLVMMRRSGRSSHREGKVDVFRAHRRLCRTRGDGRRSVGSTPSHSAPVIEVMTILHCKDDED